MLRIGGSGSPGELSHRRRHLAYEINRVRSFDGKAPDVDPLIH